MTQYKIGGGGFSSRSCQQLSSKPSACHMDSAIFVKAANGND